MKRQQPTEDPLARSLFTRPAIRTPVRSHCSEGPPSWVCLLCGIVVVLMGLISLPLTVRNYEACESIYEQLDVLINTDIPLFFKTEPFNRNSSGVHTATDSISTGAFPLSLVAGIAVGLMVHLWIYYDSTFPGLIPRSPYTPQRQPHLLLSNSTTRVSLGYKMVTGNILAFGLIFLLFFRAYLNLPFI